MRAALERIAIKPPPGMVPVIDYQPVGKRTLPDPVPLMTPLTIVIVLIVATAFVAGRFTTGDGGTHCTWAATEMAPIATALDAFEIDTGRYPTNTEGLNALIVAPSNLKGWQGPYLKSIPLDPWGHPYVYVNPGIHFPSAFDLSSDGPDGKPGTSDDVTNWQ